MYFKGGIYFYTSVFNILYLNVFKMSWFLWQSVVLYLPIKGCVNMSNYEMIAKYRKTQLNKIEII